MINQKVRSIAWLALALILILVFYTALNSYRHRGLGKLSIHVVPSDSQISIDGSLASAGSVYIIPGAHTVKASKDGFAADTERINVTKKGPNDIYLAPTPVSAEALKWASDNPQLEQQRERFAQTNQNKIQDILSKTYPFLKNLPVETSHYTITYGQSLKYPNNPSHIALFIHADTDDYKQAALDRLKYLGVDINQQEIIYSPLQ